MPSLGLGIGIPFIRPTSGGGIDSQAQAHYDRVIADGGVVPSGLIGVNSFFTTVKAIYGTTDITTAISTGYDPQYLGYKLGAGSGTTLGQAARTLYSCSGASGDVTQTTAASQPLLLAHSGVNYYYNSGESSNSLQSPDSVANQITGTVDFDYCFEILPSGNFSQGFGKVFGNGSGPSYACFISSGGNVQYIDRLGSYTTIVNISSFAPSAGNLFWVRLTLVGTTATCFTSTDGTAWTNRGTATVADLSVSNSAPIQFSNGSFTGVQSKGYRLRIYNGLRDSGGTLVVDCNPASYNAATSQTQWTSATGEVWSINVGTATTGYKGVLVDRSIVQGDGIDDRLISGTLSTRQYFTRFAALKRTSTASAQYVISGNPVESHLVYNAQPILYNTPSQIIPSPVSVINILFLLTGDYNSTNSKVRINTNSDVTGTTGVVTSTVINLFSAGNGTNFANWYINSLIDTISVSNDTQKTAIYNYLRSINNSAF